MTEKINKLKSTKKKKKVVYAIMGYAVNLLSCRLKSLLGSLVTCH